MWVDFMKTALKDTAETPPEVPTGIVKAFINPETGLLTASTDSGGIWEFFQADHVPTSFRSNDSTRSYNHAAERSIENLF
jgi:penicillin-binding protein 1A